MVAVDRSDVRICTTSRPSPWRSRLPAPERGRLRALARGCRDNVSSRGDSLPPLCPASAFLGPAAGGGVCRVAAAAARALFATPPPTRTRPRTNAPNLRPALHFTRPVILRYLSAELGSRNSERLGYVSRRRHGSRFVVVRRSVRHLDSRRSALHTPCDPALLHAIAARRA